MSNEYKDWIDNFSPTQRQNLDLIVKYPILAIQDEWNEDIYSYEETWLNDIPEGWRIAFGEQWAQEIQAEVDGYYLENKGMRNIDKIYILQLKEKYGKFTQYFSHYTPKLREIIEKYEKLSEKICVKCGKPAEYRTTGWVCPFCGDCIQQVHDKYVKT